ncbi:SDR family NAD(P)-dependent oxidoreductase [Aquincola tertiaricarbonis]|uniref:SDR family NAD(P)-dependent oxidoreductase n=1 Tax=Aquincola tertiaricarbonis TaxID=391953 RepID=UPI000614C0B0|nr:SDR family oxidoreductase [Aquincola tertiaricarbonis]
MTNTSSPVAVITGGGTGLGLATGLELRARGYRVLALGLDTEPELEGSGITFERMDITDAAAVQAVAIREPDVSVLVNAAGVILREGREFTIEGFRQVVDINLNGTQLACLAFREALARQRGAVLNFASMWSYFGSAHNPAYTASKGAVVALTRSLAVALAPQHIRVNAVAPGWIKTRMAAPVMADPLRSAAVLQRLPAGMMGEPADVAKAAAFLLSADARYITGVTLPVDGGYSIA